MSREEIQKLLGGYATDTLSEAERRALFEAALEDQELFDSLAKELALREVLQDPAARQQLIAALGPAPEPLAVRAWRWLREPAALAMAGGMAAWLIVAGIVLRQTKQQMRREVLMADAIATRQPAPAPVAPSAALLEKMEPHTAALKPKRLAQLSKPTALPAQREAAPPVPTVTRPAAPAAPPSPPAATAGGALAGAAEARSQTLQMPAQNLIARDGPPRASMSRAQAPVSAPVKLGVEYAILLKDADGAYAPVPSGAVFQAGDSVRIRVEPSEAGYIYLLQRDATAGWNLVASQRAEKAQRYELPSTGALRSDKPTQLDLLVVLSRLEQPALASAPAANVEILESKANGQADATLGPVQQPAIVKIRLEYR